MKTSLDSWQQSHVLILPMTLSTDAQKKNAKNRVQVSAKTEDVQKNSDALWKESM